MWLGDYVPSKYEKPYLANLPPGYQEQHDDDETDKSQPPTAITYESKSTYFTSKLICSHNEIHVEDINF
jgi:hypothetical protein